MKSRNPDEIRNLIRNLSDFEILYAKPARYWHLGLDNDIHGSLFQTKVLVYHPSSIKPCYTFSRCYETPHCVLVHPAVLHYTTTCEGVPKYHGKGVP